MGADVSKNEYHDGGTHRWHRPGRSVAKRPTVDRRKLSIQPYRVPTQPVFECSLEDWHSGYHWRLGFEDHVMTCYNRLDHECSKAFCVSRCGILSGPRSHAASPKASSASCPADCSFASSTPQLHLTCNCGFASGNSTANQCTCVATCSPSSALASTSSPPTGADENASHAHQRRTPKASSLTDWVYLRKRRRVSRMAEHFEYNHLPAYLSSIENFHVKSVLCARGSLVVLHLECSVFTQFGIVDLHTSTYRGVFGRQSATFDTDSLFGDISPDLNRCLIRLPVRPRTNVVTLNTGQNNFSSVPHILQLYDMQSKELLYQISLQTNMAMFAFDPRFCNSRIAITNFERNSVNSISLMNLNTCETRVTNQRINEQRSALHPYLRSLIYTPDGFYLLAITTDAECHCRQQRRYRALLHDLSYSATVGAAAGVQAQLQSAENGENQQPTAAESHLAANRPSLGRPLTFTCCVLHSDSLVKLYAISFDRYLCGLHLCSANFTPLFSSCGTKMAFVRHVALPSGALAAESLHVYRLPPIICRLESLCRIVIRQQYDESQLRDLVRDDRLPQRLFDFLLFKPTYTCAGSCLCLSQAG